MALEACRSDAALVRRVHSAVTREAFGVLRRPSRPSILSVTTRMLGPAADAEDVAQETSSRRTRRCRAFSSARSSPPGCIGLP